MLIRKPPLAMLGALALFIGVFSLGQGWLAVGLVLLAAGIGLVVASMVGRYWGDLNGPPGQH